MTHPGSVHRGTTRSTADVPAQLSRDRPHQFRSVSLKVRKGISSCILMTHARQMRGLVLLRRFRSSIRRALQRAFSSGRRNSQKENTETEPVVSHNKKSGNERRARIGDLNRVFLLVSNLYPAILGTMIWEFMGRPFDPLIWVASLMLVIHFSLDFLYLKLNLDFYGAEGEFRYGWSLFLIDLLIVGLIRLAFTTLPEMAQPRNLFLNPFVCFVGIYLLYVTWEFVYLRQNPKEKRSPFVTVKHYIFLAVPFTLCAIGNLIYIRCAFPDWVRIVYVTVYMLALTAACVEHYWSVFIDVKDTRSMD